MFKINVIRLGPSIAALNVGPKVLEGLNGADTTVFPSTTKVTSPTSLGHFKLNGSRFND